MTSVDNELATFGISSIDELCDDREGRNTISEAEEGTNMTLN
jgi:hypothetical protein